MKGFVCTLLRFFRQGIKKCNIISPHLLFQFLQLFPDIVCRYLPHELLHERRFLLAPGRGFLLGRRYWRCDLRHDDRRLVRLRRRGLRRRWWSRRALGRWPANGMFDTFDCDGITDTVDVLKGALQRRR